MSRSAFLEALIGNKWDWHNHNCWEFACHVERELFGRSLPSILVPEAVSWKWVCRTVSAHAERENWAEIGEGPLGLIMAGDGALVLMGRASRGKSIMGHIGVWLRAEQTVIHCDEKFAVCNESPPALRQQGWLELKFFEPK